MEAAIDVEPAIDVEAPADLAPSEPIGMVRAIGRSWFRLSAGYKTSGGWSVGVTENGAEFPGAGAAVVVLTTGGDHVGPEPAGGTVGIVIDAVGGGMMGVTGVTGVTGLTGATGGATTGGAVVVDTGGVVTVELTGGAAGVLCVVVAEPPAWRFLSISMISLTLSLFSSAKEKDVPRKPAAIPRIISVLDVIEK